MAEKNRLLLNRLECIGILLYFIILFVERALALIFSVHTGDSYALISGNVFNYVAYAVAAASLVFGTALTVKPCLEMLGCLRSSRIFSFETRTLNLAVAVTVMLLGGMMHTGLTLAGAQFAAYGFLIASMIIRAVEMCLSGKGRFEAIASVIYLTLFSMTIPVCYISFMASPLRQLFFTAEFLSVFLLVPTFGYMFFRFMKDGVTSFSPILFGAMLLLSGAVIGFGWKEDANLFVLIFVGLTLVAYAGLAPVIYMHKKKG